MTESPLVTVIIPAYNAAKFIHESVQSALGQTYKNIEVIVVNDGSTDDTAGIVTRLIADDSRLRMVHKVNGGLSSARNAGIREAKGEYVCFLDADDIILVDKIERQAAFLAQFPGCGIVYSDLYVGNENLVPMLLEIKVPPLTFPEILIYRNWFGVHAALTRKSVIDRAGEFDETLRASEDWDYWIRCSAFAAFSYLPGPVGVYRTHPGQMHNDYGLMRRNYFKVAYKNFGSAPDRWKLSQAVLYWLDAKHSWGEGNYFELLMNLGRFIRNVRSKYQLQTIRRLN